jgi:hypothetical protein
MTTQKATLTHHGVRYVLAITRLRTLPADTRAASDEFRSSEERNSQPIMRTAYSARITIIRPRPMGRAMVAIPSATGIPLTPLTPIAVAPVGFVTTDQTSRTRAKETVVPDEMTGTPPDDRTLYASGRFGRAG